MAEKRFSALPGFGLTMGFTLFYLSAIVIIPIVGLFLKASELSLSQFWEAATTERAMAAYELTFGASFIAALVNAGVMLAGEGLQPSSKGVRVKISGSKRTVIDGPFAETKELVAGFWIWQVKSKDEAIEWVKKYPFPFDDSEIEIRQVLDA